MPVVAIDLGGTKLASAVFSEDGTILHEETIPIQKSGGDYVAGLILHQAENLISQQQRLGEEITSIGIAVPGIYYENRGTVWVPNIDGWENYPLCNYLESKIKSIKIRIDSDRACYIMGEAWQGGAKGCRHAVYLAVGTGIGAGIMIDGKVLRGANDIAGAIGWMALEKPYKDEFKSCGCFESRASGEGIALTAKTLIESDSKYNGVLKAKPLNSVTSHDVFQAYEQNDPIAHASIQLAIELWGMSIANLVSLFNPEKIILGGGVFGPATRFIPDIIAEAKKWAQPISINKVSIEASQLGIKAGLYGAGLLALGNTKILPHA